MKNTLGLILFFTGICLPPAHALTPASVGVNIKWEYDELKSVMQIYEVAAQPEPELWKTGQGKTLQDLPVTVENKSSHFTLTPGDSKLFVLVMKNDSDVPIYFFAAPHSVNPPALSLGFHFKCLCVNRVYEIPPHGYWYRIVELNLDANTPVSRELTVTHTLIKTEKPQM